VTPSRALAQAASGPVELAAADRRALVERIVTAWERDSNSNSPNTLAAKHDDLVAFARFLKLTGTPSEIRLRAAELLLCEGFSPAHQRVRAWLAWMGENKAAAGQRRRPRFAASTRARRLAHLRGLIRTAQEFGLPWGLQVKGPPIGRRKTRNVTGPEAWRVYAKLAELVRNASSDPLAARDALVLQLLFVHGLRRQSVADLDVADVRDGVVWVWGKGREEQAPKTLPPSTQAAIAQWLVHRGTSPGPLITSVRQGEQQRRLTGGQIRRRCHEHGLGHPHGLRHSGATKLAREGYGVFDLQAHLDHADAQSSQIYVDKAADTEGRAAAYLADQLAALYDPVDDRTAPEPTEPEP